MDIKVAYLPSVEKVFVFVKADTANSKSQCLLSSM